MGAKFFQSSFYIFRFIQFFCLIYVPTQAIWKLPDPTHFYIFWRFLLFGLFGKGCFPRRISIPKLWFYANWSKFLKFLSICIWIQIPCLRMFQSVSRSSKKSLGSSCFEVPVPSFDVRTRNFSKVGTGTAMYHYGSYFCTGEKNTVLLFSFSTIH